MLSEKALLEHIENVTADMELEQEILAEAGKGNAMACMLLQVRRETPILLAEEIASGNFKV